MQHNEDKNGVEGELPFANDVTKFHILKKVQYTMLRIPQIEECLTRYKMSSIAIMELWETFTSRAMKQTNVQMKLPMKAKPPKVEQKGWEDNAFKVTLTNL
jgi:hypothetical protein